ncbi:MAG: Lrp/AsnC family transcriptional regulator [Methanobacteriota archaeon]|jgi:Lrp/AsnC family transcriptional regulator for asnA, asnC and gidA|nr:Lrp/AsnC family transcriptional regulator [Candidatus Hydrothermarchaeota archaeon]
MDERDKKILEVLQKNSRTPYKEISRYARISDVAVHKRIRKLADKVIRAFTITMNQKEYGKETTAIVAITCEVGRAAEIAGQLSKIEDVTEVYTTIGDYDVVAKIRTRDMASLKEIVEKNMTRIKGINEIRTSIVFGCTKENVNFVI